MNTNCCEMTDHTPQWAGDGYFCGKCMLQFRPCHTTDTAESDFTKGMNLADKYAQKFDGKPTADTSDWRERFREQFVAPPPFEETLYSIKPEFIEVFIENELERQQKKDSTEIRDGEYLTPREIDLFERGVKKGYEKGRAEGIAYEDRAFSVGKSEAFSLVREIVKKMTHEEKGYWGTERLKIFGWNGALTEFITRLSTLEGK